MYKDRPGHSPAAAPIVTETITVRKTRLQKPSC